MKKIAYSLLIVALFLSCSRNPLTKRRSLSLIPNSQVLSLSNNEYSTFLNQHKLSTNSEQAAMVKTVGSRVAKAVEDYLRSQKMESQIKDYKWEFNLVEDPQVNAWCMPGGKVVVYTGILPLTQSEAGLAVVLGHEIGHAVAKHGNERMSQQLLSQLGGAALSIATLNQSPAMRNIYMAAYGAGTEVGVLLPFSRKEEYEADYMGLIFMAMAGYDPRSSVDFWKRMAAQGKGAPPEFLSTHPADKNRIKKIERKMGEALKYYRPQ